MSKCYLELVETIKNNRFKSSNTKSEDYYTDESNRIARAQMYSAALAEGSCNLFAISAIEIREYETEIFRNPLFKKIIKDY